jgi:hypothetical protein
MWFGVAVGAVHAAWSASYPWIGEGIAANGGRITGGAIGGALLARGACWLWLRRQGA